MSKIACLTLALAEREPSRDVFPFTPYGGDDCPALDFSICEVPLANGRGVAMVNGADYERVMRFKWRLHSNGYAITDGRNLVRTKDRKNLKRVGTMYLHQLVLCAWGRGYDQCERPHIDHIDGNKLDNRLCNLRFIFPDQNAAHARKLAKAGETPQTFIEYISPIIYDPDRWIAC